MIWHADAGGWSVLRRHRKPAGWQLQCCGPVFGECDLCGEHVTRCQCIGGRREQRFNSHRNGARCAERDRNRGQRNSLWQQCDVAWCGRRPFGPRHAHGLVHLFRRWLRDTSGGLGQHGPGWVWICDVCSGITLLLRQLRGAPTFDASASTTSASFTVIKAKTAISIAAGAPVNGTAPITATVTADSWGTAPSGNIIFFVNGAQVGSIIGTPGSSTSLASETATFNLSPAMLTLSSNSVTAQYQGDVNYNGSAMSAPVTLNAVVVTSPAMPAYPSLAQVFEPGTPIPIRE